MSRRIVPIIALLALSLPALVPTRAGAARLGAGPPPDRHVAWTAGDLFNSPAPYALGHRGYGADSYDPSGPSENTLDAFHLAFRDDIRVVELDLQRTADGKIVVFHDDYLQDFTCVSALTYDELLARKPGVPLFRAVLNSSRHFAFQDDLSGVIFAEIKVPVPLCDAANTSEQAAVSEADLVAAVLDDIHRAGMEEQVILNSVSPSILAQAASQAPEIRRALSLNALQLLTPAQACAVLPPNLCPVRIPKADCGLEWYNIGPIARLPRYPTFPQFLGTALGCAGSQAVSIDRLVLLQNPAAAPAIVAAAHGVGLEVVVWTVDTAAEWDLLAQAGVDGLTTNDIALGLARQAPILAPLAEVERRGSRQAHLATLDGVAGQGLELVPPRDNPSRDGALQIEFALPDGGPARLDLVDVAGRLVETAEVGSLGPGAHTFAFHHDLRPGIYLVRLSHAVGVRRTKVAVVR